MKHQTKAEPDKIAKGKFVLGPRTYNWQATIGGVNGYGKTKEAAIKDARAELRIREIA